MVFKKKVLLRNRPWMINKRRRQAERSKDDNRSELHHIPLDLTLEILSRLPPKSILRYRCVSKLWSSFVTLPSFIKLFSTQSAARSPRLLLTFLSDGKQLVVSFPQNPNPDGSYSPVCQMKAFSSAHSRQSKSVHGLFLLSGFRIWNPTLRRVFILPRPKEHIPISLFRFESYLGYDPMEGKHKVLCLYYGSMYVQPLILTLGGQESWRIITNGRCPMHYPAGGGGGWGCFNGVLYFQAKVDGQRIIMSFDVKSESFSTIKYPEYSHFRWSPYMIPYEGRIAFVTDTFAHGTDVELYILKDANGHEWTHQHLPHVPCQSEWRSSMQFTGITDAVDVPLELLHVIDATD
ncbi:unnamed protein product [Eruca vesicaria subsp. sativa]|uniref:F-box domain-containing protein n=1 Tax=Eruca vesicaria subsp. sativa TaxID=29727 RepID=A0ABC8KAY8_ERUVS|nr:unnamed protein product [Eruca vesicaria subsp. sativa]